MVEEADLGSLLKPLPQFAGAVIAIKPNPFGVNVETAEDNKFQQEKGRRPSLVQMEALKGFNNLTTVLVENGIEVLEYEQFEKEAPDSIFPDWFTCHKSTSIPKGAFVIYPMKCPSRRLERGGKVVEDMKKRYEHFIDLTALEEEGKFLEGKGPLVFDVRNRKVYVNISQRAHLDAVNLWVSEINKIAIEPWRAVTFTSIDDSGDPVYHTDCQFTLLDKHVVWCKAACETEELRDKMIDEITNPDKNPNGAYQIIEIDFEEMHSMCSNMFCLQNKAGEKCIIMSKTAFEGFKPHNLEILKKNYVLCVADIDLIEEIGGGSARCMLAEVF